jgi:hypothetical protein
MMWFDAVQVGEKIFIGVVKAFELLATIHIDDPSAWRGGDWSF